MVSFSARRILRSRQRDAWDALADIEVFIFATEAELAAMEAERVGVHRRGRKPDPELRRRLLGLIWMLTFGGMQWRIAGFLSGIPFTTLHSAFAPGWGCGAGSGSAWRSTGASRAATRLCRPPSLWIAARCARRRPAGCAASMAAS
jgi:hypothetical protein